MKFLVAILLSSAVAMGAVLRWDWNPEPNIAGYRIYAGTYPRAYDRVFNVGMVQMAFVPSLAEVTYYTVTAYDQNGLESNLSEEVSHTNAMFGSEPPIAPTGFSATNSPVFFTNYFRFSSDITNAILLPPLEFGELDAPFFMVLLTMEATSNGVDWVTTPAQFNIKVHTDKHMRLYRPRMWYSR